METHIRITIDFTTSDPDYTGMWGEQNLTNDLVERLGCEESDIDIEYVEQKTE